MEKSISEWTAHRSWARPHGGYSTRGCFLATIWPHITTWTLFKPTWAMLPDYVYPYMTTVNLILMTPSSRIEAQIISHWFVEHVSEFRTLSYWTESWWLEVKWEFASWMTSWQVCSNCLMLLCQCGPKSAPCWIYAKKNRDGSEAKRPSTLKLYLIKRSVSVWTDQIFFSSTTCLILFIFLSNIWQQTTLLTIFFLTK